MNPNLESLPKKALQVIEVLQSIGFVYCDQSEFIKCDLMIELGIQIIIEDFAIEVNPGIWIFHIPSGHWWFHENDEFSVDLIEKLLRLIA
jgi:hypothetical protein